MMAQRRNLTDRAYRYRAQKAAPRGQKICGYCGSKADMVEHINGREEDTSESNLMYACRSCNGKKGFAMKRAGLGRRTHQYNPPSDGAVSLAQWVLAVMSAKGESDAMSVRAAVSMIHATPKSKRQEFARSIWQRRRDRGTDKTGVPF